MRTLFRWFLGLLVVIALFCSFPLWVIPYRTASGEHTGYVTAVERKGVFFKTWTAYVKTSPTSSQEDVYCVIDRSVIPQLQQAAQSNQHVDLYFVEWLKRGVQNCKGESAIITKVVPIN